MAEAEQDTYSQELANEIARIADAKLAEKIVVLDMRELVAYTDFLVICTARNERQAGAIGEEIHLVLKHERSMLPVNPDRSGEAGWNVLDYLDVVGHVFTEEARENYDLEELWHEAPRLELDFVPTGAGSVPAA